MEIHQLRYVLALARTGNFSRAAELSNVSQPSLSQQIQKLESELGERLFERRRTHSHLTVAGERFVTRAERILFEVEEAKREAREVHALIQGEVVVGVLPTIAPYLIPGPAARFGQKYPGIGLTILEETTAELLKMMNRHEIDFAVASLPLPDERMKIESLLKEELFLALPPLHPLNKKRKLSVDHLQEESFVMMKDGHCLGDQILRFCQRNNFQPQVRSRSSQLETILAFVEAGQGISLVPAMAKKRSAAKVVFHSLAAPRPEREVVAFWQKNRSLSRAAAEFLQTIKSQLNGSRAPKTRPEKK